MKSPQLGLIEGFYGREWTQKARLEMIQWLGDQGFHEYVYAPKSDALLRAKWQQPFSESDCNALSAIGSASANAKIKWGVGLSPLGAVHEFGHSQRSALARKLDQLNALKPSVLAILFDDMHCSHADLAERQCLIVEFIAERVDVDRLLVCPSFYSHDPILERVFGSRPTGYWETLGASLDREIDVFWTGNEVCSKSVMASDLEPISHVLKRPLALWDNYPVNDGERASNYLHIQAFSDRDSAAAEHLTVHYSNPMNQCALSKLSLATLAEVYKSESRYLEAEAQFALWSSLLGESLAQRLTEDRALLSMKGLQNMTEHDKSYLKERYENDSHPAALELIDWLHGGYAFDPACLTETEH
ncbi:MAG: beta-N-acetylglucosaminidase domain-containing protein [Pseudomonadota bacterium]